MRRALITGVVCAAMALAVAGVSSAASPLAGVYQVTIKGKVVQLNGTWLMSFAPNGAYAIVKEPKTTVLLIGGTSTISGKTITFDDKTGPLACAGKTAVGKYSWQLSGKTLKLTNLTDKCGGRLLVLTSTTFTKVR